MLYGQLLLFYSFQLITLGMTNMGRMKDLAIELREQANAKLARIESNHHVSHKFRHGIRDWVEPNQTNRLSNKQETE